MLKNQNRHSNFDGNLINMEIIIDILKKHTFFHLFHIIFGVNKEGKMQKMETPSATDHAKFGSQKQLLFEKIFTFTIF